MKLNYNAARHTTQHSKFLCLTCNCAATFPNSILYSTSWIIYVDQFVLLYFYSKSIYDIPCAFFFSLWKWVWLNSVILLTPWDLAAFLNVFNIISDWFSNSKICSFVKPIKNSFDFSLNFVSDISIPTWLLIGLIKVVCIILTNRMADLRGFIGRWQ